MNYTAIIADYTATEAALRERVAALHEQAKTLPLPERDTLRKRIALLREEIYDVALVRLELTRRQKEDELC